MKRIIEFLESDETLLRAAMMLMGIYAVHNAYILHELEHFDITFSFSGREYNFLKPLISLAAAFITEFVVLILFVKGERLFGHLYAVGLFALNTFYYCYFMPVRKTELIIVSVFVSFIHFAATWYLSDLFHKRRNEQVSKEKSAKPIVKKTSIPTVVTGENKFQLAFEKSGYTNMNDKGGITEKSSLVNLKPSLFKHADPTKIEVNESQFYCDICNVPFSRKFTFQRHMKNIHPEITELSQAV